MLQLPIDLQERIKTQMTSEQLMNLRNAKPETPKLIHIPMQTFPPTAMVYSVPNPAPKDHEQDPLMVPVSLIAKVLAPPEMRQRQLRTYFCVKCKEDYPYANKETQTCVLALQDGDKHVKGAVKVHRKVRHHSNSSLESDVTFSP
ncbi:hypothetical protein DPMN_099915 [Dreissena polymorpha]|uniref:Uncharacterized protein n=1 Tax=Dreissena polymorpha TaxID=45954 RepID=A0A9D4R6Z5_DREPO|nr:hypothetical protein DPMN_099915 [Dreissena polymorpha]